MTWFTLTVNIISLVVGFVLGLLVQWRQQELRGKVRLVPTFVFTAKRVDLVLALAIVVAISGTVVLGIEEARKDRECNLVLREAIETRTYSNEEQRAANSQLIEDLVVAGPVSPERRAEIVEQYKTRIRAVDDYVATHPLQPAYPGCGL